jgi:hypothetical protein
MLNGAKVDVRVEMSPAQPSEEIHQHSGWLIPAGFAFVIMLLSGLFLGWYLRPGPKVAAAPTDQSDSIAVTVNGTAFTIPANYIQNSTARAGGAQDSVSLAALFPSWHGYSDAEAKAFAGNAPDSPVVRLLLRADASPLDARARLARIYRPYIPDPSGTPGAFGLIQYSFTRDSGYERDELFAGQNGKALVLLLCERSAPDLPSPNCLAPGTPLGKGVTLTYRFKRAYLSRWREMSDGADSLMARFQAAH